MSINGDYGQGDGTLGRAAKMVGEARADFMQLSSKLEGQISAVDGQWGGQGANAFRALNRAWTEKHRTIVQALEEFSDSLTLTERENIANDEQQSSNMTHLLNRLPH